MKQQIIDKQAELDRVRKSYIDFLGEQFGYNAMFLKTHGITCSEKEIEIGLEYRKRMNALESELQALESQEVITTDEDINRYAESYQNYLEGNGSVISFNRGMKQGIKYGAKWKRIKH